MLTLVLYNLPTIARAPEMSVHNIEKNQSKGGRKEWENLLENSTTKEHEGKGFFVIFVFSLCLFLCTLLLLLLARVFSDDVNGRKSL